MRSKSRSDFANSLVDTILGVIRKTISSTGHSQIAIGNFKKSFRYPQNALSFIWGSFEATHGKARNLSTIQRTGDFSVHVQGSIVSIFGSLGLRELSCNYDRYRAKVWGIGPSGKIFMTAGSNSAKLKLISNGWITSIEDISNIIDLDFRLKLEMIKNLRTSRSESPRLMAIEADMLQDILVVFVDFGALSLECEYEMVNSDMMNLLPVTSDGLLNATIESTRAQGRVGYVITGDSLQVNNFDLQYEIGQIHLEAIYTKSRDKLHSRSTRKSIEETILKGVRRDIENYFEGQLREKLDNVLQDVSLNQLFGENVDLTRKYVMRSKSRSDFANSLVDTILGVIRKTISSTGHSQIAIGNFKKSFRYPQNALSFIWGSFEATHGKARNLSTIQRTGDFSVHVQGSIVSIFGSLGLRELSDLWCVAHHLSQPSLKYMNPKTSLRDGNTVVVASFLHLENQTNSEVKLLKSHLPEKLKQLK
uniref:Uncharacterized protein n=1 Tax=Lutzomyia longipalpis TaxID=7200 RepID=A0A1B0CHG6_LUTLO